MKSYTRRPQKRFLLAFIALLVASLCQNFRGGPSGVAFADGLLAKRALDDMDEMLFDEALVKTTTAARLRIQATTTTNAPPPTTSATLPQTTAAATTTSAIEPEETTTEADEEPTTAETSAAAAPTQTPNRSNSSSSNNGNSSNTGLIIGLSVGGGVLVLIVVGIYVVRKWKLRPSNDFKNRAANPKVWQPQVRTAQTDCNFLRELHDEA